jgi:hypothetical protein
MTAVSKTELSSKRTNQRGEINQALYAHMNNKRKMKKKKKKKNKPHADRRVSLHCCGKSF